MFTSCGVNMAGVFDQMGQVLCVMTRSTKSGVSGSAAKAKSAFAVVSRSTAS
jgi:hypothetical protein